MKDSISGRVKRVISGAVNGLVDAVENAAPEAIMEEAVREVEGVIEEVRTELGKVIADKHLANKRLLQASKKLEELADKINLAVKENRDDLAEAAISRQLDIEAQLPILEERISELGGQEKKLEGYIGALQGKRREMQEDLRLFRASRSSMQDGTGSGDQPAAVSAVKHENRIDRADAAFERVLGKAASSPPSNSNDRETAAKLAELDDLSRKNRISERLAALKSDNKM